MKPWKKPEECPMPFPTLGKELFRKTIDQRIETLGRKFNLLVTNRDFMWLRPTLGEELLVRKLEAVERENN